MSSHNNKAVVNSMSGVVGGYGGGIGAAAFALVLFVLLVIILRAGTGIY
jgi:hypothetical protein